MTTTTVEPAVERWDVPPECQGQIVEYAFAVDEDGDPWRRRTDRADGLITYTRGEFFDGADPEDWEPTRAIPTAAYWAET